VEAKDPRYLKDGREPEKPRKYRRAFANFRPSRIYARGSLSRSIKVFHQPCFLAVCFGSNVFIQGLHEVLEGHVFVGIVDLDRCLSLVQHSTQLYLLNHGSLA
jgi:hypothetical protein